MLQGFPLTLLIHMARFLGFARRYDVHSALASCIQSPSFIMVPYVQFVQDHAPRKC